MTDTGWTFQGYRVFESEYAPDPNGIGRTCIPKERTMTINHIDQLAQWYESAEQITETNLPRAGDTLILPYNAGGYGIEVEGVGWTPYDVVRGEPTRILSRAPKPKPAWHDAVAVMARCSNAPEGHREPFIRSEATRDVWAGEAGHARTEDLRDVTPLIEAKVTDEMVDRILDVIAARFDNYPAGIGEALAIAALGLEPA